MRFPFSFFAFKFYEAYLCRLIWMKTFVAVLFYCRQKISTDVFDEE